MVKGNRVEIGTCIQAWHGILEGGPLPQNDMAPVRTPGYCAEYRLDPHSLTD